MEKFSEAEERFRMAVGLQPGYVTAWNNLGNSFETRRMWREVRMCTRGRSMTRATAGERHICHALEAYEESLSYDPNNTVALERKQMVSDKLDITMHVAALITWDCKQLPSIPDRNAHAADHVSRPSSRCVSCPGPTVVDGALAARRFCSRGYNVNVFTTTRRYIASRNN
eukprot:scaffold957_cov402-Prasinococcus_capsulatus_cf.AAC.17